MAPSNKLGKNNDAPTTESVSVTTKSSTGLSKADVNAVEKAKSSPEAAWQFLLDTINGSLMARSKQLQCTAVVNHLRSKSSSTSAPGLLTIEALNECLSSRLQAMSEDIVSKITSTPPNSPCDHSIPGAASISTEKPTDREVLLLTAKMAADSKIRSRVPQEVKDTIETAIKAVGSTVFPASFSLHGVRLLSNGNVVLQARSGEEAEKLREHQETWVAELGMGAMIGEKLYSVVAHGVPTQFHPGAATACEVFYSENRNVIGHPSNVKSLRWLHGARTAHSDKTSTSVIITINDQKMADTLLWTGSSFCGHIRETQRYIPPPTQCFNCQAFGHMAPACPFKDDPTKLSCARCAANHRTSECQCTSPTKCTDRRSCTHVKICCANCGGSHKSFDNSCPIKQRAQLTIQRKTDTTSPYFDPKFEPPRLTAGRC